MDIIIYENKSNLPLLFLNKCSYKVGEGKIIIKANIPFDKKHFNQNEIIEILINKFCHKSFVFKIDYGLLYTTNEEIELLINNIDKLTREYFEFTCLTQ